MKLFTLCIFVLAVTGTGMISSQEVEDRAAIVESVESYVAAFNQRDAHAVSQHWAINGEIVEPGGNLLVGRDAIRESFEKVFAELEPEQTLSIRIERIAFVTPDVAIEEGTAYVIDGWETRYTATHKREQGLWVVFNVRESTIAKPVSHYDKLRDLEWMIGNWVDSSDEATIQSSCNWSKNQNFIRRNFKVSLPGVEPLEGTQIIGYDASEGTVRSWIFDSDGGTGSATWNKNGNRWEVTSRQVLADGRIATATNIFEKIDNNRFTWSSVNRTLDGESLPDVKPAVVNRIEADQ